MESFLNSVQYCILVITVDAGVFFCFMYRIFYMSFVFNKMKKPARCVLLNMSCCVVR